MAVAAAIVLLVFFFVNTLLVFGYLELGRLVPRDRLLGMGLFQLVALLLARADRRARDPRPTPTTASLGLLLAFFPVVLASFVLRGFSSMEEKYARVARENRELDVMREISNIFSLGARPDRYRADLRGPPRARCPSRRMAFVEWIEDSGDDDRDPPRGIGHASAAQEIRDWIRSRRLDEALDATAELGLVAGRARSARSALSAATRYQLVARLSTYELNTGLLILESSFPRSRRRRPITSLRALAGQIALVLQDRAIRAQVQELSDAQPRAGRDARTRSSRSPTRSSGT